MLIGSKLFDFTKKTVIIGILNVTPDSFSDGGQYYNVDAALKQTEKMIQEGADIIDVGGESTRPGHKPVEAEAEIDRVVPVIEAIRKSFDVPLSIDTTKALVADAAVAVGADMINDVWGFKADPEMATVASSHNVVCCLTHNRLDMEYADFINDVINDLRECIRLAESAGISREKIIIDPGLGFAKDYEHNISIMNNLEKLHDLGFPILLGASRKRFIGQATEKVKAEERDIGTVSTTVMGIMKGCQLIRVHNVAMNKEASIMADAVIKHGGRK